MPNLALEKILILKNQYFEKISDLVRKIEKKEMEEIDDFASGNDEETIADLDLIKDQEIIKNKFPQVFKSQDYQELLKLNKLKNETEQKIVNEKKRLSKISRIGQRHPIQNEIYTKYNKKLNDQENINISGPNVLTTLKSETQTIQLFGEYHGYTSNCTSLPSLDKNRILSIVEYLEYVLSIPGVLIDLYIEVTLFNLESAERKEIFWNQAQVEKKLQEEKGDGKLNWLVQTRDVLKSCLMPEERYNCHFYNSRIHSTDLRPFHDMSKLSNELSRPIESDKDWKSIKEKYKDTIDKIVNIKNCKDYTEYIIKNLHERITKQLKLSGIPEIVLSKAIFKVCSEQNIMKYLNMFKELIVSENKPDTTLYLFEEEYIMLIEHPFAIIHDIYTFLRMLTPMDKKIQKNIIFYGGSLHTMFLTILLKEAGFREVNNNSIQLADRCLQIKNKSLF